MGKNGGIQLGNSNTLHPLQASASEHKIQDPPILRSNGDLSFDKFISLLLEKEQITEPQLHVQLEELLARGNIQLTDEGNLRATVRAGRKVETMQLFNGEVRTIFAPKM